MRDEPGNHGPHRSEGPRRPGTRGSAPEHPPGFSLPPARAKLCPQNLCSRPSPQVRDLGRCDDVKMGSHWSQVGPDPVTSILTETERKQGHTGRRPREDRQSPQEAHVTKGCPGPPEAARAPSAQRARPRESLMSHFLSPGPRESAPLGAPS